MDVEEGTLVSVIIPVYNVEKYLWQCIGSVLAQTHYALDIILVDDGSTDRSGKICDEFAASDGRIRVIHQPNKGLSEARNAGLDAAHGEFVTFVDSDDTISYHTITILLNCMAGGGIDIACGGFLNFRTGDAIIRRVNSASNLKILNATEFLEAMLYQHTGDNSVWGKLYKKEIFKDLRFTPGILYEDLDIIYKAILSGKKVAWTKAPLYHYRVNQDSILHNFSLRRADVLDVTDRMVAYLEKNCPQLAPAACSRRLSAHFNIYCLMAANGISNPEIEARCLQVIKEERGKFLFDKKVRLKNRLGILLTYLGGFRALRLIGRLIYR